MKNCNKIEKCCVDIIICILTSLILFLAGLIVGAFTGLASILGIGAIIAIIAILAILLIIRIINLICCKENNKCKEKSCDYDHYC